MILNLKIIKIKCREIKVIKIREDSKIIVDMVEEIFVVVGVVVVVVVVVVEEVWVEGVVGVEIEVEGWCSEVEEEVGVIGEGIRDNRVRGSMGREEVGVILDKMNFKWICWYMMLY